MKALYTLATVAALALPLGAATAASKNIVDSAAAAGTFKTLLSAAEKAGLAERLAGTGPYTVFAPTDEAFAKFDQAKLAQLLKPENKVELVELLEKHIVPGKVLAIDIRNVKSKTLATASGATLKISSADANSISVGPAKVITSDILASNGVIHVVDRVIEPKL